MKPTLSTDTPLPLTHHLEELRWRILYCLLAFIAFSGLAYFFVDPLINWLSKPIGEFVFTTPTGAFFVKFKVAASAGLILAFPFFLFHLWRFIEVALKVKERSFILLVIPSATFLFYAGLSLALFGVAPLATKFLLSFSSPDLRPMISIEAYLSFLFWMIMGFGVLFQLPLFVMVLSQLGIMDPASLGRYRKHVAVGLLLLSALLTPGPDVFSQIILAVPCYVLFEASLLIAKRLRTP